MSRLTASLLGVILTGAALALAGTAANWSSASEAQLVFAGKGPRPPLFQVRVEGGNHFFYVTSRPVLKNKGAKSGAVQRVSVVPVDLKEPPRELKILHVDKREIAARETKEVRCEFVAVLDSAALHLRSRLEFRVHFYGPDGQEIYWEGITIENIARSPSHRRRAGEFIAVHRAPASPLNPDVRLEPLTIMRQVQVI